MQLPLVPGQPVLGCRSRPASRCRSAQAAASAARSRSSSGPGPTTSEPDQAAVGLHRVRHVGEQVGQRRPDVRPVDGLLAVPLRQVGQHPAHPAERDDGPLHRVQARPQAGGGVRAADGARVVPQAGLRGAQHPVGAQDVPAEAAGRVQPGVGLLAVYSERTSAAIRRMTSAAARATSCTASLAGRTYSGGATAAPTTTPTTAPMTVSTIRPSTAMSEPPTARISIALIGTSAMSSPSRNSRPMTSDTATASPRLHQVSGTTVDRAAANRTPSTHADDPKQAAPDRLVQRELHDEKGSRSAQGPDAGCPRTGAPRRTP